MRKLSRLLAVAVCLASFFAVSAAADEIWIAPGEKADVTVGDWGVTPTGEAHFSFAVPDSLDEFVGAQVMVIGRKNKSITYDVDLSISQDGANHAAFNAGVTGLPLTISTDEVTAVDVGALFPTLNAGSDMVGLHFRASSTPDLRVIGLRFQFTRFPDQAGLSCPIRHVLVGFAPVTGAPICLERRLLLEGLLCPPSHFLIGFDPVTGNPRCGDKRVLLAGLQCSPGEFVTGFDAVDGSLLCNALGEGEGEEGIQIGINNIEGLEGHSGLTPFVFTVEISASSPTPISVDYATRGGSAVPVDDFVASSGTVTFAPGELTKTFTVHVVGDTVLEDVEIFFVDLSDATGGATIADGEGVARIFDDDGGGGRDE